MKKLVLFVSAATAIYYFLVRPWHLRWGATDKELEMDLPGDENVPEPQINSTHAITIEAPPEYVWPWIVQIGQDRGGFYSYRWLENLVGCRMPDVREIVPEWQQREIGDGVYLHPKAPPLKVVAIEPARHMVLEDDWALYLHPIDADSTRLVVRSRGTFHTPDLRNPVLNFLYWRLVFEPAHFIMERKMMLGIKERAEREYERHEWQEPVMTGDGTAPA